MNYQNESLLKPTMMESKCFYDHKSFETDRDAVSQIIICIINAPTTVISLLANLLVITSVWRTPSLHLPSNVLLAGLAFTDFSVSLVAQPTFQATLIFKLKGLADPFCHATLAQSLAGFSLCGASMLILAVISLDRYIALYLHLRYQEIVTVKRVITVLAFIWIASILGSLCHLPRAFRSIGTSAAAVTTVSFSVTGATYFMIYRIVRRQKTQINSQFSAQHALNMPRLKKSSTSMFLISFTFVLCFVPCVAVRLVIQSTGQSVLKQSIYEMSILLVFINSVINPFLYCWRFKRIRKAVIRTARDICVRSPSD